MKSNFNCELVDLKIKIDNIAEHITKLSKTISYGVSVDLNNSKKSATSELEQNQTEYITLLREELSAKNAIIKSLLETQSSLMKTIFDYRITSNKNNKINSNNNKNNNTQYDLAKNDNNTNNNGNNCDNDNHSNVHKNNNINNNNSNNNNNDNSNSDNDKNSGDNNNNVNNKNNNNNDDDNKDDDNDNNNNNNNNNNSNNNNNVDITTTTNKNNNNADNNETPKVMRFPVILNDSPSENLCYTNLSIKETLNMNETYGDSSDETSNNETSDEETSDDETSDEEILSKTPNVRLNESYKNQSKISNKRNDKEKRRSLEDQLKDIRKSKHKLFNQNHKIHEHNGKENDNLEKIHKNNKVKPWPKNTCLIVGDSMIKGLDKQKLSSKVNVKVRSFPGAVINDMYDYLKPLIKKRPHHIILHVGTNDTVETASTVIVNKLLALKQFVKKELPMSNVIILTPILRTDIGKASLTTRNVSKHLLDLKISLIGNSNITPKFLNMSGLHLNISGIGRLALNLKSKIRKF